MHHTAARTESGVSGRSTGFGWNLRRKHSVCVKNADELLSGVDDSSSGTRML
jgi:hypothetical protein